MKSLLKEINDFITSYQFLKKVKNDYNLLSWTPVGETNIPDPIIHPTIMETPFINVNDFARPTLSSFGGAPFFEPILMIRIKTENKFHLIQTISLLTQYHHE